MRRTCLTVAYVNGNIVMIPKKPQVQTEDIMTFAGIGRTVWGATHAESMDNIRKLRAE